MLNVQPLEKIQSIFEKYTTSYHFYLKDLRSGQEYELGVKKRYPICSCFKLAVLMAYFDSIKDPKELEVEVVIPPEKFSAGGGIVNYFTTPVKFTYLQLAQMMMAFSDGTATDILIERVGMDVVNAKLKKISPLSNIASDVKSMVSNFRTHFDISKLKNTSISPDFSHSFTDFTNAKDLSDLAESCMNYGKNENDLQAAFKSCFEVRKQLPRTSLFFSENLKTMGKGGSLGDVYFGNDCGVTIENNCPLFAFGICAYGFRFDKDINEILFGIIGLSILSFLGIEVEPNSRWTQKTGTLLE